MSYVDVTKVRGSTNSVKIFPSLSTAYPIVNGGTFPKLNPLPGAPDWGAMEGLAEGAGVPAAPAPKVKTPEVLLAAPNALAPPN